MCKNVSLLIKKSSLASSTAGFGASYGSFALLLLSEEHSSNSEDGITNCDLIALSFNLCINTLEWSDLSTLLQVVYLAILFFIVHACD